MTIVNTPDPHIFVGIALPHFDLGVNRSVHPGLQGFPGAVGFYGEGGRLYADDTCYNNTAPQWGTAGKTVGVLLDYTNDRGTVALFVDGQLKTLVGNIPKGMHPLFNLYTNNQTIRIDPDAPLPTLPPTYEQERATPKFNFVR